MHFLGLRLRLDFCLVPSRILHSFPPSCMTDKPSFLPPCPSVYQIDSRVTRFHTPQSPNSTRRVWACTWDTARLHFVQRNGAARTLLLCVVAESMTQCSNHRFKRSSNQCLYHISQSNNKRPLWTDPPCTPKEDLIGWPVVRLIQKCPVIVE